MREIREARNAIKAYDRYEGQAPDSQSDLLSAHHVLMAGPLDAPGRYRRGEAMYYDAIRQSSAEGESTTFIAFMLQIIRLAVSEQT